MCVDGKAPRERLWMVQERGGRWGSCGPDEGCGPGCRKPEEPGSWPSRAGRLAPGRSGSGQTQGAGLGKPSSSCWNRKRGGGARVRMGRGHLMSEKRRDGRRERDQNWGMQD